jgi:hypothetical protein
MESGTANEIKLSPGFYLGLPSVDFRQNGIVWLVRPSCACQVLHMWLDTWMC